MLKLTFTLVVALYAGFVIWGEPDAQTADASSESTPLILADSAGSDTAPVVLETNASSRADVSRSAITVPDASSVLTSTPEATTANRSTVGEPVRVSLVQPSIASAPSAAVVPQIEENANAGLMQVTGTRVNMRAGPSTDNSVVDSLVRGTIVEVLGEEVNGWVELRDVATGVTGFMAARFIEPAA